MSLRAQASLATAGQSNLIKKRLLRYPGAGFLAITLAFILLTLPGCSLFGIHIQVKNPKHTGKYPKFSTAIKLLGASNKYRTCFDATHYTLNVFVDPKNKYLKGKVEMSATALSDFDTLQIDLFENMKINKIGFISNSSPKEEGSELVYKRKYGAVYVVMPKKISTGEKFKLIIDYEGKPVVAPRPPWRGGFVWKKEKEGNPWIGVACESEGASLWWPCKDVTNDEPDSAAINITVPSELTGVSNGTLIGKETNGAFSTYKWRVSYPINLYNITLYVGKFSLIEDTYTSNVSGKVLPMNHYVLPVNYEKAKKHFQQAKEQIAFFEKIFGEYPWYKDGYKLIESPYEGMEHQSAIAYGNGYKTEYLGFDYIILHESAHEWWGNSISAADLADVWLHEGFATYAEALFVESTQGKNAYLRYLLTYRLFIKNKRPVVGPTGTRFFDYKDGDVYMKGAWILHTLRTQLNDDKLFFDILKSFRTEKNSQTVNSQDFINTVNDKTGEDYTWFFNQYLYKREAPFLEYCWDGIDFYYRWKFVDSTFKLPAEISLDGLVLLNLKPAKHIQKMPVSGTSYKDISFNNYTKLFGLRKNKKLKKEFLRQNPAN